MQTRVAAPLYRAPIFLPSLRLLRVCAPGYSGHGSRPQHVDRAPARVSSTGTWIALCDWRPPRGCATKTKRCRRPPQRHQSEMTRPAYAITAMEMRDQKSPRSTRSHERCRRGFRNPMACASNCSRPKSRTMKEMCQGPPSRLRKETRWVELYDDRIAARPKKRLRGKTP